MRCLIFNGHALFAELLGAMLRSLGGLEVMLSTHEPREALAACRSQGPGLLILDADLPDCAPFSILERLHRCSPSSRAIILSRSPGALRIPPRLRACVYSVLDRDCGLVALRAEIQRLRASITGSPASTDWNPAGILGPREYQLFLLIGRGLPSKLIADEMNLSKPSVDTYRKRIAAKLRTRGAELVRLAALHSQMPLAA